MKTLVAVSDHVLIHTVVWRCSWHGTGRGGRPWPPLAAMVSGGSATTRCGPCRGGGGEPGLCVVGWGGSVGGESARCQEAQKPFPPLPILGMLGNFAI